MAAALVVCYHMTVYWRPGNTIIPLVSSGCAGVNLFFILSGFILAYTYLRDDTTTHRGWRDYYIARIARIYPLYLVALLVAIGPYTWLPQARTAGLPIVLMSIVLMQAWVPFGATLVNPPAWSLSVEAAFYALFPLIGPAVARLSPRRLLMTAVAAWVIALLPPLSYAILAPPPSATVTYWMQVLGMNPLVRLPEFVLGLALGRLYLLGYRPPHALLRVGPLLCAGTFALAFLVPQPLVHNGLLDPLFSLTIFALASGVGRASCILARPAFVRLGEASFAIYILQWPLWDWLTHLSGWPAAATATVGDVPLLGAYVLLLVSLSLLAQRLIEVPARHVIRQACARVFSQPV